MALGSLPPPKQVEHPDETGLRAEIIGSIRNFATNAPRNLQRAVGPSEVGTPCLTGDTEVVTRQGVRAIRDIAEEGGAELLLPQLYNGSKVRMKWGTFKWVPVESFGEQRVYAVTLRRNQERKTVHATAEHAWFRSYFSGKQKTQQKLTTIDLQPGHRLTQLRRAKPTVATEMPVAVAQGFVFGDGTSGTVDGSYKPALLHIYHNGKDEALLPYFPGNHGVYHSADKAQPYTIVRGLPRFWKELPPIAESKSFLTSWLAGYFAADGSVTEDGVCVISSANRSHLDFVRDVASVCGIGYGQIQGRMRRGISGTRPAAEETMLYKMSLRRRDLPEWFLLTERHAERARAASHVQERDPHWIVESVTDTDRTETVYCAITGEPEAFGLADDLMTGNCARQLAYKMTPTIQRSRDLHDPWPSIIGTATHVWLADCFTHANNLARQAGKTPPWHLERRVDVGFGLTGSCDCFHEPSGTVLDWKILGETQYRKYTIDGPSETYETQADCYGLGYVRAGYTVRRVGIGFFGRSKRLSDLHIWSKPFDLDNALRALKRMRQVQELVQHGVHPLRVPATPGGACYFCEFRGAAGDGLCSGKDES